MGLVSRTLPSLDRRSELVDAVAGEVEAGDCGGERGYRGRKRSEAGYSFYHVLILSSPQHFILLWHVTSIDHVGLDGPCGYDSEFLRTVSPKNCAFLLACVGVGLCRHFVMSSCLRRLFMVSKAAPTC